MVIRRGVGGLLSAVLLLAPGACTVNDMASPVELGPFDHSADIGKTGQAGSARYDAASDLFTITGAGENMWADTDAFRFVWKRIEGDFIIRSRVALRGEGSHEHRKLGVIARTGLGPHDTYVDVAVHGDGLTSMQYRREAGAQTEQIESSTTAPDVVQLERRGGEFVMSVAQFGSAFVSDTLRGLTLADSLYVGLFVCSHDSTVTETGEFDDVRLVIPAPAGFTPYQDYIGSRIEILDVRSGERRIVHTDPGSMQAPNWTPDAEALIFNQDGLLKRIDLATSSVDTLDTGFATSNNNDHVLSFDGARLGVSHHSEDHDDESIIYTLPAGGGEPSLVTPLGPSYLHGWSPDGAWLVYTGGRNGKYDIYRIPSDGGVEEALTDTPGLDDGPEYSPDGDWIWFNSVRSGTMQLWRMRADGTNPEQMTHDGFNNWFPHLSPDGSRLVFLSYGPDVDPSDHPFYRHVTIRMMPSDGSEPPTVVAYVYGGQGTINVPSWSPDGTRVAFVSNSAR